MSFGLPFCFSDPVPVSSDPLDIITAASLLSVYYDALNFTDMVDMFDRYGDLYGYGLRHANYVPFICCSKLLLLDRTL